MHNFYITAEKPQQLFALKFYLIKNFTVHSFSYIFKYKQTSSTLMDSFNFCIKAEKVKK